MSKCENCIHYSVCEFKRSIDDTLCGHYKDKSLCVEFPCKVGDTVHYLTSIDTEKELNVKEIFCGTVQAIGYDGKDFCISAKYTNGLFYYHNSKDFGKTVFLTKEEAEQKLQELGV